MRYVFISMMALLTFGAQAQNQPKKPVTQQPAAQPVEPQRQVNPMIEHFIRKHALASRWNDAEVVKNTLYDLIAENPANDSLVYTLAVYYYENRQYVSSVLIAQDMLSGNPKNVDLLQLAASCYESLGIKEKALASYETVYLLNNNTAILYKMTVLQFDLKKFTESKTNADILLTKQDVDSMKVTINGDDSKMKEYPIKAAIFNLKGLLALQANDKAEAKKEFEQALAIAPDFPLAKQNLAKLK